MKMCMLAICAIVSFSASVGNAACIGGQEAKEIAAEYLDAYGEVEFPYAFAGNPLLDKPALIGRIVSGLTPWEYQDGFINGYIAEVYAESNREREYYEFVTVSCDGRPSKLAQRRD